jgi:Na+/proline symporter
MNDNRQDNHWLTRPETIRKLWWGFAVVLALTTGAQLFIYVKGYFGVDGWFGFGAAFGFLSCLAMVLFAKGLGFFLKRDEGYYAGGDDDV